jgi:shikimate kinase
MKHMVILIMGMKHSGKSSIGKKLAGISGLPFYDLDKIIEAGYRQKNGRNPGIREIYSQEGADGFRRLEAEAARTAAGFSRGVIALGGGTPENKAAMDRLAPLGTAVLLEEDPDVIYDRIKAGGIPPFLNDPVRSPREIYDELYQKRRQVYRRYSDVIFPVNGKSVEQAAEFLLKVLNNLNNEET